MTNSMKGFSLVELLVVVLIMGIMASFGVPHYQKTVETSKATEAAALGHLLGAANRTYHIDYSGSSERLSGQITSACNSSSCSETDKTACRLVACRYIARQEWDQSPYNYYVCNGATGGSCCSADSVACTVRGAGAASAYSGWGYRFSNTGACQALTTDTPACPKY